MSDPMRPRDPQDVVPGWSYTITLHWQQTLSGECGFGRKALFETDDVDFAYTLVPPRRHRSFPAGRVSGLTSNCTVQGTRGRRGQDGG